MACEERSCLSRRTLSVLIPRRRRNESKGERAQPEALMVKAKREARGGEFVYMIPAMRSWCPERYFVADS